MFITGDLHGSMDIQKLVCLSDSKTVIKDEPLVILGDFGLVWNTKGSKAYKEEQKWIKWLDKQPWITLFIDGNHENFDLLDKLPTKQMFRNDVGVVSKRIFHLRRGRVYDVCGSIVLAAGGAQSTDRKKRIPGVSWWPQELWNWGQEKRLSNELDRYNWKVDFVFSHAPPRLVFPLMDFFGGWCDPTCKLLDAIEKDLEYDHWFFGHMHEDKTVKNFTCLYNKIVRE